MSRDTLTIWKYLDKLWSRQNEWAEAHERKQERERQEAKHREEKNDNSFDAIFNNMVPLLLNNLLNQAGPRFQPGGLRFINLPGPPPGYVYGPPAHPHLFRPAPAFQQQQQQQQANDASFQNLLHQTLYTLQPNHHQGGGGQTLSALPATSLPVSDTKCAICLSTVTESTPEESWSKLPCCNNYLHLECAKRHLQNDRRCPMCRRDIQ
jgi:hypothetical protein